MRHLLTVYVHRYDEKNNIWQKHPLENVMISDTVETYSLSDTLRRDARLTLRVMGNDAADVMPQDVISFSESADKNPPDSGTAVVVSVTKNSRGSNKVRHTKIICR